MKSSEKTIFFKKSKAKEGYETLVSKNNSYLKDLEVGRLRLGHKGASHKGETKNEELLIQPLIGSCDIILEKNGKNEKFQNVGRRTKIFEKEGDSLLIEPNTKFHIICTTNSVDCLMPSVKLENISLTKTTLIKSENVEVYEIGENNYKRKVRVMLGGNGPAAKLRGGETINEPGQWSSWPRHSFDNQTELANQFEEFFMYFTLPKEGYGLQRCDGYFVDGEFREQTMLVRNGDYAVLPLGDHPIVAAPDNKVLYVWFYISPIPKIYPKWAEDHGEYA